MTFVGLCPGVAEMIGYGILSAGMFVAAEWRRPRVPWRLPDVSIPAANVRVSSRWSAWVESMGRYVSAGRF